jgi:RNA polymerase sigma-70 factor (ECF subfamily)
LAVSFVKTEKGRQAVLAAPGGGFVEEVNERRLVRDLRSGRSDACAELIRLHYEKIYRLLAHLTRDSHQAEDLTQETFVAAWERIGAFRGEASLGTWLYRIAYTRYVDVKRAQERAAGSLGILSDPTESSIDPLDSLVADDEARRLYEAMDELEKGDRTVLVLHYLQDLSYREMAAILKEPIGTVKWRTSEALSRLRTKLTDRVEFADDQYRRTSHARPVS